MITHDVDRLIERLDRIAAALERQATAAEQVAAMNDMIADLERSWAARMKELSAWQDSITEAADKFHQHTQATLDLIVGQRGLPLASTGSRES